MHGLARRMPSVCRAGCAAPARTYFGAPALHPWGASSPDIFRLFDEIMPRVPRSPTPRFDVREIGQEYQLQGEVPGFAQKDLDIEFVDERTLVVRGTIPPDQQPSVEEESEKATTVEPASTVWLNERSEGKFERRFAFPGPVNQDEVRASLRNGILSIVVPKLGGHQPRRIPVEA